MKCNSGSWFFLRRTVVRYTPFGASSIPRVSHSQYKCPSRSSSSRMPPRKSSDSRHLSERCMDSRIDGGFAAGFSQGTAALSTPLPNAVRFRLVGWTGRLADRGPPSTGLGGPASASWPTHCAGTPQPYGLHRWRRFPAATGFAPVEVAGGLSPATAMELGAAGDFAFRPESRTCSNGFSVRLPRSLVSPDPTATSETNSPMGSSASLPQAQGVYFIPGASPSMRKRPSSSVGKSGFRQRCVPSGSLFKKRFVGRHPSCGERGILPDQCAIRTPAIGLPVLSTIRPIARPQGCSFTLIWPAWGPLRIRLPAGFAPDGRTVQCADDRAGRR